MVRLAPLKCEPRAGRALRGGTCCVCARVRAWFGVCLQCVDICMRLSLSLCVCAQCLRICADLCGSVRVCAVTMVPACCCAVPADRTGRFKKKVVMTGMMLVAARATRGELAT